MFGKDKKDKSRRRRKDRSKRKKKRGVQDAFDKFIVEEIEIGSVDNYHLESPSPGRHSRSRPRSNWLSIIKFQSIWLGLWALLVVAAIVFRVSLLPDESFILTKAWDSSNAGNMFLSGLDDRSGILIAPLFIWLVQLGWRLFGFVEWWPFILSALFGLLSLSLVSILAKRLWPLENEVARYAPLLLLGSFVWAIDLVLISSHMAHFFFVSLSVYALILMRDQVRLSWLFFGVAASLAAMTGGLVSFVYTLPVAILGPVWLAREVTAGYWYRKLFYSLLVIIILTSVWLAPVFTNLGLTDFLPTLKNSLQPTPMILFEPNKPGWWYAIILPLMLLPWTLWPLVWMRFSRLYKFNDHGGVGFCFTWVISTVLVLSLFEVKQAYLLIPVLPAIVLFTSYLLLRQDFSAQKDHESPFSSMGFPIILLGGLLAILPNFPKIEVLPDFLWNFSPMVGIGLSVVGITLAWMPVRKMKQQVTNVAIFSLIATVFLIMWAWWQFGHNYQVEKITGVLAKADANGAAIAQVGQYNGQYGYSGRLSHPVQQISKKEINAWIINNPDGLIITGEWMFNPENVPVAPAIVESHYLDKKVIIWSVADIIQAIRDSDKSR